MNNPQVQIDMNGENQPESAKRLAPTKETLRELFLKSGNLCAFPGCNALIMDKEGRFIAELCHIEAAEKGGERFNEKMTNEERRAFGNLVILCHEHHVVTNDVGSWQVARMQEMKANHESKVFDFIDNVQLRIVDYTTLAQAKPSLTHARLAKLQNWSLGPSEIAENVIELNVLLNRLRDLPVPARELLVVIISKANRSGLDRNHVSWHEIQLACNLENEALSQICQILDKYCFICDAGEDDYGHAQISLRDLGSGWQIWDDFRAFTDAGFATLHELIVDLNFSLLDEPANPPI